MPITYPQLYYIILASESISAIKNKTDLLTFDDNNYLRVNVSSLINPPNLDVTLTVLSKLQRWGLNVEPEWVHAAEVTAPSADTALVSKTVSAGKTGYVFGFFISAGEANDFRLNWVEAGASNSIRIVLTTKGSHQYVDFKYICKADAGSTITITNVNAGSSGIVYQARILYGEA